MRFSIIHRTEYKYASPVRDSFNEVRLQPLSNEQQTVESFRDERPLRFFFENRGEYVGNGFALEQSLAGQHLVDHNTEGPNVGALVDRFPARLLRRHICGGTHNHSRLRGSKECWRIR